MSQIRIIVVVGATPAISDKSSLLSHIKEGLATIPHFESLKINDILNSSVGPEQLPCCVTERFVRRRKNGAQFTCSEANITLLHDTTVEYVLEELDNAINVLPQQIALVYTGVICQSNAHWVLSDAVLKPDYIAERISLLSAKLHQTLADTTKESMPPLGFHVACSSVPLGGEWRYVLTSRLPSTIAGRPLHVTVNRLHPPAKRIFVGTSSKPDLAPLPCDLSGVEAFCQRLEQVLPMPAPSPTCQPAVKTNGCSIRIQRPCLYIFPEGSGQSAIFALPGFTLMVNVGCSRNPKCWRMAQHLENIDAILHTHWGAENTLGLASLLPAFMASSDSASALPKVTCILTPPPGHMISQPPSSVVPAPTDPLVLNVAKVAGDLALEMRPFIMNSRLFTLEVNRGAKMSAMPKPLPLYYKAGFGSLELYPLTPTEEDNAEVKKLAELWSKSASGFATALAALPAKGPSTITKQTALPLVSQLSVSALLIWKPARKSGCLLRILFVAPNAHQLRVLTALEAVHVGLPYIHQAEPLGNFAATAAGTGRKVTSSRPATATSAPRASAHVPKSATPLKTPGKSAPKVEASPAKSTPSSAHKPMSALAKAAPPSKTTEAVKEKVKTDKVKEEVEMEANTTLTQVISEASPVSKDADLSSNKPELMESLNGGGDSTMSNDKAMDDNQYALGVSDADSLNPVDEWGQPQAMPAPAANLLKNVKQGGAKSGSPAPTHPEGYYEASLGSSKGLYDKLGKKTFVDVAFLPGGGDVSLVDAEFFKHVPARYYVATTVAPTAELLKALVVGKEAWNGDKATGVGHEVSLILAHDTPALLEWASLNEKRLTGEKIDLLTVAERSTIQLVSAENAAAGDGSDNGLSCPGFRLDF